jgi:hypothetical protein
MHVVGGTSDLDGGAFEVAESTCQIRIKLVADGFVESGHTRFGAEHDMHYQA